MVAECGTEYPVVGADYLGVRCRNRADDVERDRRSDDE